MRLRIHSRHSRRPKQSRGPGSGLSGLCGYQRDGRSHRASAQGRRLRRDRLSWVRCGFTVMPKSLLGRTERGQRFALHQLWHRRWSTKANSVSYPVQRGAEALYSPEGRKQVRALINHYMGNAKILREAMAKAGMEIFGGVNAPYLWVKTPDGLTSWKMFDRMLRDINVVVTPGSGFGAQGEGYFRISAFNSRDNAEEVARRLEGLR